MEEKHSALKFFFNHRKLFLIALLIGGMLGVGVTFFIPKKYMSTAIIYPANAHTRHDIVANPQFGYEIETEQLMQLLESKSMRDRTIAEFKLYDYYKLDTSKTSWESTISLKYIEDVSFFRSKYLSVVINVKTEDPELSARIANFQVSEIDKYRNDIFQKNRQTEFEHIEREFLASKDHLEKLKDSIYEIKGGKHELLYNFIQKLDNQNTRPEEFVDDPRLESLIEAYVFELSNFENLEEVYEQSKQGLSLPLPSVYSIDEASPSYKKVSPSFVINSILGSFLILVLTLCIRLILDKWKVLKSEISA